MNPIVDTRWQGARRLLCIRLDYLGDVLMTTPALRALKHALPDAQLTLLTSASGAAAAGFIPEIDEVIAYAAPWMKADTQQRVEEDRAMIARLAEQQFDAAIIFTVYSQSALPAAMLCHLAGIPLRLAHCRENPYRLLTHWVRETEPQEQLRHEVQRQLDLVANIGAHTTETRLSFTLRDEHQHRVQRRLAVLGIDISQPWVVMHPGATATSRRYPPMHWRRVAELLDRQLGCPLLFTGSEAETGLIEEIRSGLPRAHSLAGDLSLSELAALIAAAPIMISNNTGPVHIAAALGTPVVDLYALTNPQHTPWQVPNRVLYHDVPCRHCMKSICPQGHHDCLAKVKPEQVVEAALALLAAGRNVPPPQAILAGHFPPA